ncbi:MAG TPA: hypothetical protein VMZ31_19695 [Phycisphaerae bacterium]|nr:hypothetical protein [Phycisphaerae bacterium]
MAIVKGPLHSESAQGQIGKTLIYQESMGRSIVKSYAVPGNTPGFDKMNQTAGQLAVQAQTKALMQHWLSISPTDQATWDALADPERITRINAYLKENYRRLRGGEPLLDGWPDIYSTITALIVTAGTPAPNPDCTGNYQRIADYQGKPAYRRTSDQAFFVYYIAAEVSWFIDDALGTIYEDAGWYNNAPNITTAYDFQTAEGQAIAAFP